MRQMEISRKKICLNGEEETLVYFITINELSDSASGILLEIYGIGVTICKSGETQIIPNITFSKSEVFALLDLMASNLVTPVAVSDIVNDWLCLDCA